MELMKDLQSSLEETNQYYSLTEEFLIKSYAPGKWSVKQLLVHLADAEQMLLGRIKRVISEPKQVIWSFDQDLWCSNLKYTDYPLHLSEAIYKASRAEVLFLAEEYYLSHGSKEFVQSETGLRTLKDEFDKVAWHNLHHLVQIKQALNS